MPLVEYFFKVASIPLVIFLAVGAVWYVISNKKYKKTTYYQVTKKPFYYTFLNVGIKGEYYTYEDLKHFEDLGAKLLFNAYIPKQDGGTTEIDILMISTKGIFVFESKNYSGWIYRSESQEKWCQTIRSDKGKIYKNFFFNPIWQNKAHIKHLNLLLGGDLPLYSIIVFSNRCTLKKVEIKDQSIKVINRENVITTVLDTYNSITCDPISPDKVQALYDQLYPYTQVDIETKRKHIADITKT